MTTNSEQISISNANAHAKLGNLTTRSMNIVKVGRYKGALARRWDAALLQALYEYQTAQAACRNNR